MSAEIIGQANAFRWGKATPVRDLGRSRVVVVSLRNAHRGEPTTPAALSMPAFRPGGNERTHLPKQAAPEAIRLGETQTRSAMPRD